jgi:hypothetical protein
MPQTFLFTARRDNTKVEELWDYVGYYKLKSANQQLDHLKSILDHSKLDLIIDALSYFTKKLQVSNAPLTSSSAPVTPIRINPAIEEPSETATRSILEDLVNYNFIDGDGEDDSFEFVSNNNNINNNINNNSNCDDINGIVEEELD